MAEQNPPPSDDGIAAPEVVRKKERRIAWIWLVPVVAVLIALSLVLRTWIQEGPEIKITFDTAEGLDVGKTQIRYKDVVVGTVQGIGFNEDRSKVIVDAQLSKSAGGLAAEGTNFWVVRPRLGLNGVSGLGTLLSGAYIDVDAADGTSNASVATKFEFVGLETPPVVTHDRSGKRFVLKAANLGSLDVGSPVYFRRISVGRVIGYGLDESGDSVNVEVFIDAPNDRFVTTGSRFWNASGIDLQVDTNGLKLQTQSLVSMVLGGLAFASVNENHTEVAQSGASFELYSNEGEAKADPDGEPFPIRMHFDQSIRGLTVGSTIDFQGIALGEVSTISIDFDNDKKRFFAVVDAQLYPERLGAVYDRMHAKAVADDDTTGARLIGGMIKHGLRAQLRTGNLLTGQLYIVLENVPTADAVDFKLTDPVMIPTIPGNLEQLQQQVTNIINKIGDIPFEQIGKDFRNTLSSTSRLLQSLDKNVAPDLRKTLEAARKSLESINDLLARDGSLPINAERALGEVGRAARSIRDLADFLQVNPDALILGRGNDPIPGQNRK